MKQRTIITVLLIIFGVAILYLAFSFFVFRTTSSESKALKLTQPKELSTDEMIQPGASHLLLVDQDKVFVYEDKNLDSGRLLSYSQVRDYLVKKKTSNPDLFVIIAPFTGASYKNTVDILDEMTINNIEKFMLVDPTETEKSFVSRRL